MESKRLKELMESYSSAKQGMRKLEGCMEQMRGACDEAMLPLVEELRPALVALVEEACGTAKRARRGIDLGRRSYHITPDGEIVNTVVYGSTGFGGAGPEGKYLERYTLDADSLAKDIINGDYELYERLRDPEMALNIHPESMVW